MIDTHVTMVEFVDAVDQMRAWQKRFYRTKARSQAREAALYGAKQAEEKVDALLERLRWRTTTPHPELPL